MTETVRLLSKKQLREIVLYSPAHIQRLEKAGLFPKRIKLGPHRSSRVGWLEDEVMAWRLKWLQGRGSAP